jgi:hypothetical protein
MDLTVFLEPKIDLPRITHILDGLGPGGRVPTIRGWDAAIMRRLWDAAKGYKKVTLADFVPASIGAMTEVVHEGKNSLATFTHFQKRFAKTESGAIFGYNHQDMAGWTGPGYFVVHSWKGEGEGVGKDKTDGEVAIDYKELPEHTLDAWPEIIPNSARLGRFVYEGMVDVMRGISSHVTIGRARKNDAWMDAWFVLCRIDPD